MKVDEIMTHSCIFKMGLFPDYFDFFIFNFFSFFMETTCQSGKCFLLGKPRNNHSVISVTIFKVIESRSILSQ